jgi:hypothetical protein
LNHEVEDEAAFRQQVRTVCKRYHQAPELHQQGVHVVSVDEKTGIQALERKHPTRPMIPNQPEVREFEYERHGTQTLALSTRTQKVNGCLSVTNSILINPKAWLVLLPNGVALTISLAKRVNLGSDQAWLQEPPSYRNPAIVFAWFILQSTVLGLTKLKCGLGS